MLGVIVSADGVQLGNTHVSETHIIDQNVDNVRRIAIVSIAKRRQLFVHRFAP